MITIGISNFKVKCVMGCFSEEREAARELFVDFKLKTDFVSQDALDATIDYTVVCKLIEKICMGQQFHLLETLVQLLVKEIVARFPKIVEGWIKVTKSAPFANCESSFVEQEF
jgi:dihydroneopterin aldolase